MSPHDQYGYEVSCHDPQNKYKPPRSLWVVIAGDTHKAEQKETDMRYVLYPKILEKRLGESMMFQAIRSGILTSLT